MHASAIPRYWCDANASFHDSRKGVRSTERASFAPDALTTESAALSIEGANS